MGLVLHVLALIGPLRDVTEDDVDRELARWTAPPAGEAVRASVDG